MQVIKVPREAFTAPRSAVPGKTSHARAVEAQQALARALERQRSRLTFDVRSSDWITDITVKDLGQRGFGLVATVTPARYTAAAVEDGRHLLRWIGYGDVALVADEGTEMPVSAMRWPSSIPMLSIAA